jgi:hypothetical protein
MIESLDPNQQDRADDDAPLSPSEPRVLAVMKAFREPTHSAELEQ